MEARIFSAAALLAVVVSLGASYRTANFIVEAPTPQLAEEIGKAAEQYRHDLAIEWIGSAMPNWSRPCPIRADVSPTLGAGGATSFVFDRGEVFGWDMKIQGSQERVLDSVLPHEVTHTIFASHFRQPLPRWADEGACTTVEHSSERNKQQVMLVNFLRSGRGIAFDDMFAMKEYPADVLPLYSQGYSLARYLIEQKGRREFMDFVGEGMKTNNWAADLDKHYGYANLKDLQGEWLGWVKQGSPQISSQRPAAQLASATRQQKSSATNPIYRAQNSDDGVALAAASNSGPTRRDVASAGNNAGVRTDDYGWTDAGGGNQSGGEKPAANPGKSGWYASQRDSQGASAADEGAKTASPSLGEPRGSDGASHASAYDRQPSGTSQSPAPPAAPPTAQAARPPEYVAQRDTSSASAGEHRVLMEWNRTE